MSTESESRELPILDTDRNCWRIEPAKRVSFLVDADAYYSAFRAAVGAARHSLFILGWDINSRLSLQRSGDDGRPSELCGFLNDVAERNSELNVYILIWDFAMIYVAERELLPVYRLDWRTHDRVHFRMDDQHPTGGSHHQKIVVVDDQLAFVGGIDLTRSRWDTPQHRANDPRRVDPDGTAYGPFHDVQVMLQGDAAAALGEIARNRWQRAGGQETKHPQPSRHDIWPAGVEPDLEDGNVAIARTEPRYKDRGETREVERLYLDAIASARESIYVENQYLTSESVGTALCRCLDDPHGPEIVLVLPRASSGWLEQSTMDVLRARQIAKLRKADRHGRLKIYFPEIPNLTDQCLTLHSKLMIVDDRLARVGSANLSNRSMGLDTECDVAIEGTGIDATSSAITALRDRLLAEHLGVTPDDVARAHAREQSLIKAIESLRRGERTLKDLDGTVPESVDELVPDSALIDPECAINPEEFANRFIIEEQRKPASRHVLRVVLLLILLLGLAAAWRWTPLDSWLSPEELVKSLGTMRNSAAAPFMAIGAYVIGALVVFPVTLLIVATGLLFGPVLGLVYSLAGIVLGAALTYGIGAALGRDSVRRLAGKRLNRISEALGKRGILAILTVRILPVAPYSIVNVVAGATHIRFRDYMLGTVIGMTPGTIMLVVFVDQIWSVLRDPGITRVAIATAVVFVIVCAVLLLNRWLLRKNSNGDR